MARTKNAKLGQMVGREIVGARLKELESKLKELESKDPCAPSTPSSSLPEVRRRGTRDRSKTYRYKPKDYRKDYVPKLEVKESTIRGVGKGLFTTKGIPAKQVIIEYTGEVLTQAEFKDRYPDENGDYTFEVLADHRNGPKYIDANPKIKTAHELSNNSKYINHVDEKIANVMAEEIQDGRVQILSKRAIKPNEELFLYYGDSYWTGRSDKVSSKTPQPGIPQNRPSKTSKRVISSSDSESNVVMRPKSKRTRHRVISSSDSESSDSESSDSESIVVMRPKSKRTRHRVISSSDSESSEVQSKPRNSISDADLNISSGYSVDDATLNTVDDAVLNIVNPVRALFTTSSVEKVLDIRKVSNLLASAAVLDAFYKTPPGSPKSASDSDPDLITFSDDDDDDDAVLVTLDSPRASKREVRNYSHYLRGPSPKQVATSSKQVATSSKQVTTSSKQVTTSSRKPKKKRDVIDLTATPPAAKRKKPKSVIDLTAPLVVKRKKRHPQAGRRRVRSRVRPRVRPRVRLSSLRFDEHYPGPLNYSNYSKGVR